MARERLAATARSLTPMRQGSLDGLCGLYAVINAIQLATFPDRRLTRRDMVGLFEVGIDTLRPSKTLAAVLLHGMHEPLWRKVAAAVVGAANDVTGVRLELVQVPLTAKTNAFTLVRHIRYHVGRGRPALLCVTGRINHWTVVSRVSRTRLTLFDSSDRAWLRANTIGVDGPANPMAYGVRKQGLVIVYRHAPANRLPNLPT